MAVVAGAHMCRYGIRRWVTKAVLASVLVLMPSAGAAPQPDAVRPPATLEATGLYADFASLQVDPQHLAFSPQYPLWTDGAAKRRWISLPPGTAIDGSDPDAWIFPVGTRLWKEFSFDGQRVETRYLERMADGRWLYAAYVWSADGREASLASASGKRAAYSLGGGRSHTIPSVDDCKACHQGGRGEVLGFSALQLSQDRDPSAVHAEPVTGVDIRSLRDRKLLIEPSGAEREGVPRIAAPSATERAALGYLHGNCGHCHNDQGPLRNVGLFLRHRAGVAPEPAFATTIGHPVKKPAPGQSPHAAMRIEPGQPDKSALLQRMASRYPALQMPPFGTALVDLEAVALLERWIAEADERPHDADPASGG